jgi:hypothetical protein
VTPAARQRLPHRRGAIALDIEHAGQPKNASGGTRQQDFDDSIPL